MAGDFKGRVIALLDWCWPFPLGATVGGLVLVITLGFWLVVRSPQPRRGVPPPPPVSTETSVPMPTSRPPLPASPGVESISQTASEETMAHPASTGAPELQPKVKRSIPPTQAQDRPSALKLSAKQRADYSDRMTIGRFQMERKDYLQAIASFEAALAIDPSNHEAKASLEAARRASQSSEAAPKP